MAKLERSGCESWVNMVKDLCLVRFFEICELGEKYLGYPSVLRKTMSQTYHWWMNKEHGEGSHPCLAMYLSNHPKKSNMYGKIDVNYFLFFWDTNYT